MSHPDKNSLTRRELLKTAGKATAVVVASPLVELAFGGDHDSYDQRIAEGLVPDGRWGLPEDVGRAVASLLRGDLTYATGTVVRVDGGLSIPRL